MTIIQRKSYPLEVFLRKLTKHLTLSDNYKWVEGEDVWYLGAGYWRAQPFHPDVPNIITGVTLINPDRTSDEIDIIAQAMNVLI